MNRVSLIGILEDDPGERRAGSGVVCTRLRLRAKDRHHLHPIPVVVYGRDGESALRFLRAGSKIAVDGRLCSAERRDGGAVIEVVADRIEFLDGPPVREAAAEEG